MPIDDEVAQVLLQTLEDIYPDGISIQDLKKQIKEFDKRYTKELLTLHEEGLIEGIVASDFETPPHVVYATITAQGRKFLAGKEDYQLVKLHEDTIAELRSILVEIVTQSALPEKQKGVWRKAIEAAPAAAVNEAVKTILGAALQKVPGLWNQIQTLLAPHL